MATHEDDRLVPMESVKVRSYSTKMLIIPLPKSWTEPNGIDVDCVLNTYLEPKSRRLILEFNPDAPRNEARNETGASVLDEESIRDK